MITLVMCFRLWYFCWLMTHVVEVCCEDEEKTKLSCQNGGKLVYGQKTKWEKSNVSDAQAGRHARQGWGAINQQLPECLVSPRGSSLGSLETLGVAHPTKTKKVKRLAVKVVNLKQQGGHETLNKTHLVHI